MKKGILIKVMHYVLLSCFVIFNYLCVSSLKLNLMRLMLNLSKTYLAVEVWFNILELIQIKVI